MRASFILCGIFVIVQTLYVSVDGVSAEAQKNLKKPKTVKAPVKTPQPEPEEQESTDDEENGSLIGSSLGSADSVSRKATKTGSHLLNSGTDVVKKTGRGTRRISQAGLKNGNKVADEGVGFLNGLFSDIFQNGRKIAGAKTKVLRNTGNNLTNLGVSSTNLFGQAINTPIKMLGDTADVASVGLTIPANVSNFAKGKATGVLKALGATDPSENEESAEEQEEETVPTPVKTPPKKVAARSVSTSYRNKNF